MTKPRKPSMGRRKLSIERGEKPVNIDVCFSKRRTGLFKKASELCILTGAQVAIIAFSPHGKPFLFGHPSDDSLIDHYYLYNGTVPIHGMNTAASGAGAISSEHARLAEEIEERRVFLKKEKEPEEWFKIDHQENMTLEELESLRDEWMLVREKIVNKLGILESSSSMASRSGCGCSSSIHDDNNNGGVNGFYDLSTTAFAANNGSIFHGDGGRNCNEEVFAGMDFGRDCLDVFESFPPLLEEDYKWDFLSDGAY